MPILHPAAVPEPSLLSAPSHGLGNRAAPAASGASEVACFHCGNPCPPSPREADGKAFCCPGCHAVFTLLNSCGLGDYYRFDGPPGTRDAVAPGGSNSSWDYLDRPEVAEKLLNFSNAETGIVTWHLPAIHCVACVWLLENLFRLHPGVGRSTVDYGRREATITFSKDRLRLGELAALLNSIGYPPELTLLQVSSKPPVHTRKRLWLQVGLAGFGFGNIMLMSLPAYLGLDSINGPWFQSIAGPLSLLLALPVVTYSALDYWRSAWTCLRQRLVTLDVPIALGLAAIYSRSAYEILSRTGDGYNDSLTGLIFFLLCGRLFQQKTHDHLAFDRDYRGFFPLAITRKRGTTLESAAVSELDVGDLLLLRNGELLPADAILVDGPACLDYSFVTGESHPVNRLPGEGLYAGGRQTGATIEVRITKPVSESYLTSLWNNEAFRKRTRDDLDTVTNRYSRRFTWLVLVVAAGAAAYWAFANPALSIKAFTSVLIVACPCALALAAPIATGAAHRTLARQRLFLRNATVIEHLATLDTVVLDKTGTLTDPACAQLSITELGTRPGLRLRHLAFSLARHSTHPASTRIAQALSSETLPSHVSAFSEHPGLGIEGIADGLSIRIGSLDWLGTHGPLPASLPADASTGLAVDGRIEAVFAFRDSLRPEVRAMVREWRATGMPLTLLSGDTRREAARFTQLLGPQAALHFEQTPLAKLEHVRTLQSAGRRVLMIGDGLNDAGALRQADVGVAVVERIGAFSPASDAIADVAAMARLPEVLAFSRNVVRVVRTGFLISAAYNVLGIGIAAAGLLSPLVCAILMPLSSASVVLFSVGAVRWLARRHGLAGTHPGHDQQREGALAGAGPIQPLPLAAPPAPAT